MSNVTLEVVKAPKAATKAAAAKPAAKAAQKPQTKAKPAAKAKLAYCLTAGAARPASGARLYAHTQAVLDLTGLVKGAAVDKSLLVKVMGDQAVRYNVSKGAFAIDNGKVSLTVAGKAAFESRIAKLDTALVDAYKAVMSEGKPVESVCKNKDLIQAV